MTFIEIIAIGWIYFTIAGVIMKLLDSKDYSAFDWVLDIFWPLTAWYRLANYFLGQPINMENYFLRK